jgi:hypothetical protein
MLPALASTMIAAPELARLSPVKAPTQLQIQSSLNFKRR